MVETSTIAIVGGTGKLGAAIGRRLAAIGHKVIIGSRSADAAIAMATTLGSEARGANNVEAAALGDIVIVTVPFAGQAETLAQIAPHVTGKIVVDTTVPLVPPKVMRVQLPSEGSAAVRAQGLLGQGVTVVSAFHNVAAHKLTHVGEDVDCDVLVFGDDKGARSRVIALADDMGLRGIHGGALANSAAAEALTSVLILINKTYQVDGAGIRITGQLAQADG
ncbi:NADPH-dependent F420 reductase [Caulobacter sp. LARHSG274]